VYPFDQISIIYANIQNPLCNFAHVAFHQNQKSTETEEMGDIQRDHLSGKPGNVREFDSCQRNVRDFTENQGIVREKSCQGKVA